VQQGRLVVRRVAFVELVGIVAILGIFVVGGIYWWASDSAEALVAPMFLR
jgi:hypothetical protein